MVNAVGRLLYEVSDWLAGLSLILFLAWLQWAIVLRPALDFLIALGGVSA